MTAHGPDQPDHPRLAFALGFLGVGAIGFDASQFGAAPMAIGLGLLILALPLLDRRTLTTAVRDPLVLLLGAVSLWVIVRTATDHLAPRSESAPYDWKGAWYHLRATGLLSLVMGLWIAAQARLAWVAVTFMAVGMVLFPMTSLDTTLLAKSLTGVSRLDLGKSPNALGLFASVLVLTGMLFLAGGLQRRAERGWEPLTVLLLAVGAYLLMTNTVFLLATQSRAAWVATGLLLPFVIAYTLWALAPRVAPRTLGVIFGGLLLAAAIFVGANWEVVAGRFAKESETITALLTLSPDEIEYLSLGRRWLMWSLGFEKIAEHPWWGWGPAYVAGTIQDVDVSKLPRGVPGQYHNTHVHFSVSMGLVWTALWHPAVHDRLAGSAAADPGAEGATPAGNRSGLPPAVAGGGPVRLPLQQRRRRRALSVRHRIAPGAGPAHTTALGHQPGRPEGTGPGLIPALPLCAPT
jgi:O-antigen ligase